MFCSPSRGREFGKFLDREIVESWQHCGEVFAHRDIHSAAALDDREDGGYLRSGLGAANVDPVLSPDSYWPYRVLCVIVAKLQLGVFQKACELAP